MELGVELRSCGGFDRGKENLGSYLGLRLGAETWSACIGARKALGEPLGTAAGSTIGTKLGAVHGSELDPAIWTGLGMTTGCRV